MRISLGGIQSVPDVQRRKVDHSIVQMFVGHRNEVRTFLNCGDGSTLGMSDEDGGGLVGYLSDIATK